MRRLVNILLLSSLGWNASVAQNTNVIDLFRSDFRQAEIYFHDLAYQNAIELYERELDRNPKNTRAMIQIAECYRLLKNPVEAEYWYDKVYEEKTLPAENAYNFAQVLMWNQKYDEAKIIYRQVKEQNPLDTRVDSKLAFIENMDFYLRDSTLYHVEPANINSEALDFGPAYYDQGVVFLSSRDQDLFIKHQASLTNSGESLLDLYYAPMTGDGQYGNPTKFQQKINSRFHEGPLSFGDNGKLIFTRNNFYKGKARRSSDGQMKLNLYFAELDTNRNLSNLAPFPFNNDEYSTAHPHWSDDGTTLYFSSDMPGGRGGADLYVSHYENGAWTTPVNLGDDINTKGDEMFPFHFNDRLYFSSDGHGGFGGLDIYFATGTNGSYSEVANLGYPANSSADDFSFIMNEDGRRGMFSSDRSGAREDDIYNYFIRHSIVAGEVIEIDDDYAVSGAHVSLKDLEGNLIQSTTSDELGRFHLDLPLDTKYFIDVRKEGFTSSHNDLRYASKRAFDIDSVTIFLSAHDLYAEGTIYGNETQKPLSNARVILNNDRGDPDTVITDHTGKYQFILESGFEYLISVSKELFLPTEQLISTKEVTQGVIRNDFIIEEEFLKKGLVLFDFNDDQLKPNFMAEIREILTVLKRNPSAYLIISAHADSRGSKDYNLLLSERRASNVKQFYLQNGISDDRLISRGFGEELIINRCSDAIHCQEEDHSKNRRAELKIETELPETELNNN